MAAAEYFYCRIGGAVGDVGEAKFGFSAPKDAYDDIADELGVVKLGENADRRGVLFGANYPRPPRVRINYVIDATGNDARTRSTIRFCDPDKVGRVLNGSINDKTVTVRSKAYKIRSVSMAG
jgi:hypothetical protein